MEAQRAVTKNKRGFCSVLEDMEELFLGELVCTEGGDLVAEISRSQPGMETLLV